MDESEAIEISSTEDVEFQDESSASEVIVPKRTTKKEVYIVDSDEYREESSEAESEVVTKGNSRKRTKSSGSMSTDDYFEVSESNSESEDAQVNDKKKLKKRSNASSRSSDSYFRSSTNSSSESESSDSSESIQSESESEVGNVGRRQNRTARGRKSDKSDEYLEDSSEESSSESSSAVIARSKKRPAPKNNRTGKRGPPAKKAKGAAAAKGRNTAAAVAAAKKGFPSGQLNQSDNFQRVSLAECQRADAERFIYLSKHRKLFESFVTPSVMEQLTAPVASGRSSDQHHLHHQVLSQPEAVVNVQMRDYQVEGMSWLVSNYLRSISCILGDEMGLGKTLQSIAFVAHMVFVRKVSGPFLFIVPLSVLFNWYNEFRRFCPSLSVLRFYSQDKDEQARLRTVLLDSARNDVVLATYDTVKKGGLANAFRKVIWRAVFLDEGHRVRHEDSLLTQTCRALQSQFRCILTGTPLQNNLREVGALLQYVAPNIFTDLDLFDAGFDLNAKVHGTDSNGTAGRPRKVLNKRKITKGGDVDDVVGNSDQEDEDRFADNDSDNENSNNNKKAGRGIVINRELLEKAHYLMRPFLLRRVKSEVEQKLPPKLETKINCPMTPQQRMMMQKLLFKERSLVEQLQSFEKEQRQQKEGGTEGNEVSDPSGKAEGESEQQEKQPPQPKLKREALDLAMWSGLQKSESRLQGLYAQLRKASNHPFLFPGNETLTLDGAATEEIVTASGKMVVLDKLLKALFEKGHRVVLFSQFTKTLDILSDYLDMRGYRHTRLDGSTSRVMREVRINMFNKEGSKLFVFLLTTRAGGEGVNLYTADTAILFDSDWNPQVDIQAMARVHRIGQKKIVHIYRLVTAGSVEERIVQRAQKKLFLDMMVNRVSTAQAKKLDAEAAAAAAATAAAEASRRDTAESAASVNGESVGSASKADRAAADATAGDGTSAAAASEEGEEGSLDNVSVAADASQTALLDKLQAQLEAEEAEDGGPGVSKVVAALKFGWNSVFSATGQGQMEITDEDIQYIIDRSRGGLKMAGAEDGSSDNSSSSSNSTAAGAAPTTDKIVTFNAHARCLEDQEETVEKFDEHEAWITVDQLKFAHLQENTSTTAATAATQSTATASGSGDANVVANNSVDSLIQALGITRSKRVSQTRTVLMEVAELGLVEVLKSSIDDGRGEVTKQARADAQMLFAARDTRQRAGRDYEHISHCQVCRDGGSLIVCERCPMAYHLECLGLKTMPKDNWWCCPHHSCVDCGRNASAAGLIFRCEMCELAYCEDCLPSSGCDILGESEILAGLGFVLGDQFVYIHCSPKCSELAKAEERYFASQSAADKNGGHVNDESAGSGGAGGDVQSPSNQRKTRSAAEPAASDSATGSSSEAKDRSTLLENAAATAMGRTIDLRLAIQNCLMPDIFDRLTRDTHSAPARFKSLNEIPHFHLRLSTCDKVRTIVLLLKVVCDIDMKVNGVGTGLAPQGDEITQKILDFKGVPATMSFDERAKIFLSVVKILAQGHKDDLKRLATILGLAVVVPFKRPGAGGGTPSFEPKFYMSREYNRDRLEEAVAAFLVVPTPQNLMLPKEENKGHPSTTAANNAMVAPIHCILYSLRLLESLGEYVTDANKQFFTSMTLLDDRSFGLNAWLPVYPTKKPASYNTRRKWIDPVCRLYKCSRRLKDDIMGLGKSETDWLTSKLVSHSEKSTSSKQSGKDAEQSSSGEGTGSDSDFEEGESSSGDEEDDEDDAAPVDPAAAKAAAKAAARAAAASAAAQAAAKKRLEEQVLLDRIVAEREAAFKLRLEEERRLLLSETAEACKRATELALANNFKPTVGKPVPKAGKVDWQKTYPKTLRKPVLTALDHIIRTSGVFAAKTVTAQQDLAKDVELQLLMEAASGTVYADMSTLCARLFAVVKAKGDMVNSEVYQAFCKEYEDDDVNGNGDVVMDVIVGVHN